MRTLCTFYLLLPCFFALGQNDEQEIRARISAFSEAVVNRDIDALTNAYTADASIFPNGQPILQGKDAIRAYWAPRAGDTTTFHKIYPEAITIEGNTAYDYGYYEVSGITRGQSYQKAKGKYVIVWKKVAGEWKMHLDIWNRVNQP